MKNCCQRAEARVRVEKAEVSRLARRGSLNRESYDRVAPELIAAKDRVASAETALVEHEASHAAEFEVERLNTLDELIESAERAEFDTALTDTYYAALARQPRSFA